MFNIILSEHLNEDREYLKGYRRLRKPFNFDSKVMQKILEPIKSKIKKFLNQRFVLKINESADSSMEIYFLLKFEILEDQETIVVISSLKQEKGFMPYKKIPLNNRLIEDIFYNACLTDISDDKQPSLFHSLKIAKKLEKEKFNKLQQKLIQEHRNNDMSLKIVKKAAPKLVEDYSQIKKLSIHIKNKLKKGNWELLELTQKQKTILNMPGKPWYIFKPKINYLLVDILGSDGKKIATIHKNKLENI